MQENNRNLILAIVLSVIVMFGWGSLAEYVGWVKRPDPAEVARIEAEQRARQEQAAAEAEKLAAHKAEQAKLPLFAPAPGKEITLTTPLYTARLYTGGGVLRGLTLQKFRTTLGNDAPLVTLVNEQTAAVAPLGLLINGQPSWSLGKWASDSGDCHLDAGQRQTLSLTGEMDGVRMVREMTFDADTYLVREKLHLTLAGDAPRPVRVGYTVAETGLPGSSTYNAMRLAWQLDGSMQSEDDQKDLAAQGVQATGNIAWAAAMNTYFMMAVAPADTANLTLKGRVQNDVYRVALEQPEILLSPGQPRTLEVAYWAGPKERAKLLEAPNDLANTIDLGMFSLIGKGILWLMQTFYGFTHNWGVAILLLTLLIKALFWPLTAKSYRSMEQMKKLQPMMNALKEKYGNDKEALNREMMALYKTYGVNPASGCIPILVQLPVFFGLYQALITSIELRHASFIPTLPGTDITWLADLSAADPLYITPLVMGATMFIQQKMSPPAGDATQQKIMMFLPLIFTVMFLSFPSGLVLYWLVNNILSIAQQWMMIRKKAA